MNYTPEEIALAEIVHEAACALLPKLSFATIGAWMKHYREAKS